MNVAKQNAENSNKVFMVMLEDARIALEKMLKAEKQSRIVLNDFLCCGLLQV